MVLSSWPMSLTTTAPTGKLHGELGTTTLEPAECCSCLSIPQEQTKYSCCLQDRFYHFLNCTESGTGPKRTKAVSEIASSFNQDLIGYLVNRKLKCMRHHYFASPLTGVMLHKYNLHVCKEKHYIMGFLAKSSARPLNNFCSIAGISKSTYTYILNLKFGHWSKMAES